MVSVSGVGLPEAKPEKRIQIGAGDACSVGFAGPLAK